MVNNSSAPSILRQWTNTSRGSNVWKPTSRRRSNVSFRLKLSNKRLGRLTSRPLKTRAHDLSQNQGQVSNGLCSKPSSENFSLPPTATNEGVVTHHWLKFCKMDFLLYETKPISVR